MGIKRQVFKKILFTAFVVGFMLFSLSIVSSDVVPTVQSRHAALKPRNIPDTPPSIRYKFDWEPAKGKFLVASERIRDSIFTETVIFLVDYSPRGAMGLIVNRPADTRPFQLFPEIKRLERMPDYIYIGGPVERNQLLMLIRSGTQTEGTQWIFDDIYISASRAVLERMVNAPGAGEEFRLYAGYAGWAPGQLEREIMRGDWHIIKGDAEVVFNNAPLELWQKIMNMKFNLQVDVPCRRAGHIA